MRWLRRAVHEHRRLPERIRNLQIIELWSFVAIVCGVLVSSVFDLSVPAPNLLVILPMAVLLSAVFGIGVLTWRNHEHAAEIWAENVRGRGLEEAGFGSFADTGTMRGLGAGKSIFAAIMLTGLVVQVFSHWT